MRTHAHNSNFGTVTTRYLIDDISLKMLHY